MKLPLFFCFWALRHIDTVEVISRRSSFTGGGRPQVPFRALPLFRQIKKQKLLKVSITDYIEKVLSKSMTRYFSFFHKDQ
jgi:hypothetical protein